VEQDASILGDLNLTGASDEPTYYETYRYLHLHGALWTEVGLEDLLETLGGVDVDGEGLGPSEEVGFGI